MSNALAPSEDAINPVSSPNARARAAIAPVRARMHARIHANTHTHTQGRFAVTVQDQFAPASEQSFAKSAAVHLAAANERSLRAQYLGRIGAERARALRGRQVRLRELWAQHSDYCWPCAPRAHRQRIALQQCMRSSVSFQPRPYPSVGLERLGSLKASSCCRR